MIYEGGVCVENDWRRRTGGLMDNRGAVIMSRAGEFEDDLRNLQAFWIGLHLLRTIVWA